MLVALSLFFLSATTIEGYDVLDTATNPLPFYGTLTALVLSGKLTQHLLEINNLCKEQIEALTGKMAQAEGVTEQLKATDQMAWVQRMNSIHSRAEEIVTAELIYS